MNTSNVMHLLPLSSIQPYISSYGRETTSKSSNSESFYCSVCEKQLNGPKPYQAHMASKAHKEELALLEES